MSSSLCSHLRFIKAIDIFKSPVELFLHRRDKRNNEKNYVRYMGSCFGGIVTVLLILGAGVTIAVLIAMMFSTQYDMIS